MKKLSVVLLFAAFIPFLTSCEDDCFSRAIAPTSELSMPDTATVNQSVDIDVTYHLSNGCGSFDSFDVTEDFGAEKEVFVAVDAVFEGCACTEAIVTETRTMNYTPTEAGTFIFKFYNGDNIFTTDTLIVQ